MKRGRPRRDSPALTRDDLADALKNELGAHSVGAKFVAAFFKTIEQSLIAGKSVAIHNLGRFSTATKKARQGRNPLTGELKTITKRKVVTFKPSMKLRTLIRNSIDHTEDS